MYTECIYLLENYTQKRDVCPPLTAYNPPNPCRFYIPYFVFPEYNWFLEASDHYFTYYISLIPEMFLFGLQDGECWLLHWYLMDEPIPSRCNPVKTFNQIIPCKKVMNERRNCFLKFKKNWDLCCKSALWIKNKTPFPNYCDKYSLIIVYFCHIRAHAHCCNDHLHMILVEERSFIKNAWNSPWNACVHKCIDT